MFVIASLIGRHRLVQATGSWSVDTCAKKPGNNGNGGWCTDHSASSDWLFGLWPGPPQRFEPTGHDTAYQTVEPDRWPCWGPDVLTINSYDSGAPGGSHGHCDQGITYRGTDGEICGGNYNWGATDVEVWYPR